MMAQHKRNLLYPCLSEKEKDTEIITMVEQDMIRLAGGCIVSIAFCSALIMIPLLPCYSEKQDANKNPISVYCLRLVMFLHGKILSAVHYHFYVRIKPSAIVIQYLLTCFLKATLGLAFVGTGMLNLKNAEANHSYSDEESQNHYRCSSLRDQIVLWIGVALVCSASIGIMLTFCPESKTTSNSSGRNSSERYSKCFCCIDRSRILPFEQNNQDISEQLLVNDHLLFNEDAGANGVSLETQPGRDKKDVVSNTEASSEEYERICATEEVTSSRLRGTTRLLKLAGSESMYLWLGIIVLLIRLPFSLSIPNFVSVVIGDLINADYDGAKRNILLLFLLGSVDSVLDFWW